MTPQAFLSYTRIDDEYFGITAFRKSLELGVQVLTGEKEFRIFQDIEGIELGQQWQSRLDEAIVRSTFLIPVLTPCFFQSDSCRDELSKFVNREREIGRADLILPIYFVTTPLLEKTDLLKADGLASAISARQRFDWREQADLPINDPNVRRPLRELAKGIAAAMTRTKLSVRGDALEEQRQSSAIKAGSERAAMEEGLPKRTARKRVLWVDDRPNNNIVEREALSRYNVDFELALSTDEALEAVQNESFDAIISDMGRPPDMQAGYTLLDALRAEGNTTPFFIYAGSRDPKHIKQAINRGAQGCTNIGNELINMVLSAIRHQ